MINQEVALRYSKALFALGQDKLNKLLKDLEEVVKVFKSTPHLMHYFSSPQINQKQKENFLIKNLSVDLDPLLKSYLSFLLEKRRIQYLPEIEKKFRQLVIDKLGILEAQLITPVAIDPEDKEKLKSKLAKTYKKKIELTEEINNHLIGGGILVIDNKLIDFSLKGKLEKMKEDLLAEKEI